MGKLNWVQAVITLVIILFSSDFNCEDLELEYQLEYLDFDPWPISAAVGCWRHGHGRCRDHRDHWGCWGCGCGEWQSDDADDDDDVNLYRVYCYHPSYYWGVGCWFWDDDVQDEDAAECYRFCVAPGDEYFVGNTIGHYTAHIGVATNDPCTLPGPEGTNYYLKWNHGLPFAGLRRPTHKKYGDCFESVIFNKLGYYLWVPPESDKIGMCVSPSGSYVWHHGQLPKEKQREGMVPPTPTPTLTDFVFPENNSTMKSLLGSIPPPDEEYTETPEAVTVSPQTEAGPMIIPAPQVTTAPIQTGPYIPAPSYYPPSYLPPGTTSVPKTVNVFL